MTAPQKNTSTIEEALTKKRKIVNKLTETEHRKLKACVIKQISYLAIMTSGTCAFRNTLRDNS